MSSDEPKAVSYIRSNGDWVEVSGNLLRFHYVSNPDGSFQYKLLPGHASLLWEALMRLRSPIMNGAAPSAADVQREALADITADRDHWRAEADCAWRARAELALQVVDYILQKEHKP